MARHWNGNQSGRIESLTLLSHGPANCVYLPYFPAENEGDRHVVERDDENDERIE